MNEHMLQQELQLVSRRYRRLMFWTGLAVCWLALALAGLAVFAWARGMSRAIPGLALLLLLALPIIFVPILLSALRKVRNPAWLAKRIERQFPDLDTRLLAALEQKPDQASHRMGFLQEVVIAEAIEHAHSHGWGRIVSRGQIRAAKWGQFAMLLLFGGVIGLLVSDMSRHPSPTNWLVGDKTDRTEAYAVKIEPEDTDIERGTSLLVMARFEERLPSEVQLLSRDAEGNIQPMQMSKSLNDPLFAGRMASVTKDMTYAVRYGDEQTRWYKVGVFDYPELKQADAKLKYPEYTGMSEKLVEDTRSITAVEGTNATFTFRLNKAVTQAQLLPKTRPTTNPQDQVAQSTEPVKLIVDPNDPTVYTAVFDMKQSQRFALDLEDDKGRKMKQAAEVVLNVTQNKPASIQLTWPGRDIDASPLQELNLKARIFDDFGAKRIGVNYTMAGKEAQDIVLAENVKGRQEVTQLVALEKLSAEPDQLLSYYFWAEDMGPDGTVRRTSGDMFFAEIRPFEEIFRQGQQPAGGEQEQQQQQQQQQQQGQQNAQDAEQLADLQKEIIAATWKIIRRETSSKLTTQFVPDVKTVSESQGDARTQAAGLEERLTDERSRTYLKNVFKFMEQAKAELDKAADGSSLPAMSSALSAEQAAYQELLKLRAREFEVTRQNRQQRGGQQQARSSRQGRQQRQLDQLDLDQEENRYQTQRTAQQQQEQDPAQRETRQVLSRLRELAQRQEDLNRQMREMQAALQQAREQQQREELERQLARLRDQQQQQLRDTDELRDRMDQPENQERMADSRQQLEQTREDIRRAGEALEQQQVANAASAGARASEQLNQLRDQFRQQASGQFTETVNQLRQDARELDERERQLAEQLANLGGQNDQGQPQQRQLRDDGERQQVVEGFQQQKQQLDKLLEDMRKTIEEAETPEPLLSERLYDAVRQAHQQQPDRAIDATRQLLDRGFTNEARQAEADASRGIAQLRQGIENAARSVLGDDTEALRRARNELDQLAEQLNREIARGRFGAAGGSTTQPNERTRLAQGGQPSTRPGMGDRDPQQDGQDGQQLADGQQGARQGGRRGNQPGNNQQANAGQRGRGARGQQPGDQQGQDGQQGEQQANANGQRGRGGRGQQPGDQQGQDGQGEQPGNQQANAGGQRGRGGRGQQPGDQAGQEGEQPGDQQAQAGGRRGGARGQRGGGAGQPQDGEQDPNAQDGQQQDNPQLADGQQGGRQGGRRGGRGGGQAQDGEPQDQQANAGGRQGGGLRPQGQRGQRGGRGGNNPDNADLRQLLPGGNQQQGGGGGPEDRGPLTGGNFRNWADRLRDVEEMVNDPGLRQQAAQIRDRATEVRQDFTRHSQTPNWDIVIDTVSQPLVDLRNAVNQELLRRESAEALVPIDREPVPPEYAEQVRKYYERLGSGK